MLSSQRLGARVARRGAARGLSGPATRRPPSVFKRLKRLALNAAFGTPEEFAKAKGRPLPTEVNRRSPRTGLTGAALWSNAVVLVDKPPGWTSFDVVNKVRYALKPLGIKKVGHAGTLDPFATGLMLLLTGQACKFAESYSAHSKEYTAVVRLGETTPTFDTEMEVSETAPWEHVTDDDIAAAARSLTGDVRQDIPFYSAKRVRGEKMYEKARRGEHIKAMKDIFVESYEASREPGSRDVHIRTVCGYGAYVRVLGADLGKACGTLGYLTSLRREAVAERRVEDALTVAELEELIQSQCEMHVPGYVWHKRPGNRPAEAVVTP